MSFRARLAIAAATAVALAVVLASVTVYVVVRSELRSTLDSALRDRAAEIQHEPLRAFQAGDDAFLEPGPQLGGAPGYFQVVSANGDTIRLPNETVELPVTDAVREVASGQRGAYLSDADVAGLHVRVITVPYGSQGLAIQIARPLTEVDHSLSRIRTYLLLIAAIGIALAAALGLAVARTALAPVRRLTGATEKVTETRDLSERIDASGTDELSRLAGSFNTMLAALEESTRAQQQLVGDASHELRTPLTSLRTNVEVLAGGRELPAEERERLLRDVIEQLNEMTTLVAELSELARGELEPGEAEDVRLDLLAADAIERTRRNRPNVQVVADLQESVVHGVPASIERAVANLLDNAAKWSPPDGEVEVSVKDGEVAVRDHGPGIDEADLPYVFDRFYRASSARGLPGSGLGLAIVRQVAESHGGQVRAEPAEGGGTRMIMRPNGRPVS
ncbi:MAG TPA: HAMP domain-containing sensor histidine kinase [Gaiellaceae bacterium]|nr:HAMP domain-containing sensor histidine kinase [Gaiellaceae bacterium]